MRLRHLGIFVQGMTAVMYAHTCRALHHSSSAALSGIPMRQQHRGLTPVRHHNTRPWRRRGSSGRHLSPLPAIKDPLNEPSQPPLSHTNDTERLTDAREIFPYLVSEYRAWMDEEKNASRLLLDNDGDGRQALPWAAVVQYYRDGWGRFRRRLDDVGERVDTSVLANGAAAAVNAVIIVAILRTVLVRAVTLQGAVGLPDLLSEFGFPDISTVRPVFEQLSALDYSTKCGAIFVILLVERLLCLSEWVPFGTLVAFLSPLLFGGLLPGIVTSNALGTASASVNFLIGRYILRDWVAGRWGEQGWFRRLNGVMGDRLEGFKVALLLRFAPILPIPFDAHWYVLGLTSLPLEMFLAAYFLGSLKVNIVDGIIGDQLLSSVFPRAPPPSLSLSPATPTVDGAVNTSNPIERLTALWQSILGVFTSSSTPTSNGAESDVVAALSAAVPPPLAAADAQVEMGAVGAVQQTAVEGAVGALGLAPAQAQLLVGVEILFLLILQVVVTQLSMATLTKLILEPSGGPAAGGRSGSGRSNDATEKGEKG
ncbi:unnamed protein product [Vitrella brassicaformis CCMP3155]|uniref:VTT domain-containing protein n=2 Tax=Vitrella brassicaformis TaxID=1169539 RepID=A0A0G4FGR3_VITBC|nr:unnamed protein product [Vitrella brassicaformis CCMP3155]|mmetsp:Transcript_37352/g.106887  ORF Transcript_37352/g.106887 Transcript_37352/m.106887 type:complete len:539 (-) Transcript_37352:191-1807(-)|eukprot:CEM12685.1 unnamed protein product [Vitrella brassicaformis CCMP3155]